MRHYSLEKWLMQIKLKELSKVKQQLEESKKEKDLEKDSKKEE